MQSIDKRMKLILALIGIGVVVLIIVGISSSASTPEPKPVTNSGTAASSPDVITQPVEQQAETPTSSNITRLMDKGVTSRQVDALQYAFFQFSQKSGVSVKNMVIDVESIKHVIPTDPNYTQHSYIFKVGFGADKNYNAEMILISGGKLRLALTDPTTKTIAFDSGDIVIASVAQ